MHAAHHVLCTRDGVASSSGGQHAAAPPAAARAPGARRGSHSARCCQVLTLPSTEVKATPAELSSIKDFLHHYGNGSVRELAGSVTSNLTVLEPLHSRPDRPTVLCGLQELDFHRSYDSDMPADLTISIASAISECCSQEDGSEHGSKHIYVSFRESTPYTAVWQGIWRFVSTSILAMPERQDDLGLLRFTFTRHALISEVACLRKPASSLRRLRSEAQQDSYNLCSLGEPQPAQQHPALKLMEQM